jgi:predicted ATPase
MDLMPPLVLQGFEASLEGSRPFKVTMESDVTVLVGRNGAGKSMIAEALVALRGAVAGTPHAQLEAKRTFALTFAEGTYAASRTLGVALKEPNWDTFSWEERFDALNPEAEPGWSSWRAKQGEAVGGGLSGLRVPKSASVLGVDVPNAPESVTALRSWLESVRIVRAGVPRQGARTSTLLKKSEGRWTMMFVSVPGDRREAELSIAVASLPKAALREASAIGRRLGVWKTLQVQTFTHETEYCFVKVDGVNLGMVSDGTQRVLEILLAILAPGTSLLILEEPETSLHPGLVMRLLHELDACEAQLLITTHSPQVVSHFSPRQLRLVERKAGKTHVRALPTEQAERLTEYLSDEGTLGEYVFQGGLDDA